MYIERETRIYIYIYTVDGSSAVMPGRLSWIQGFSWPGAFTRPPPRKRELRKIWRLLLCL